MCVLCVDGIGFPKSSHNNGYKHRVMLIHWQSTDPVVMVNVKPAGTEAILASVYYYCTCTHTCTA